MLFDPDAGKTWEDKIEAVLDRRPALRARLTVLASLKGCAVYDVVMECLDRGLPHVHDRAARADFHARMKRDAAPFGDDPRLSTPSSAS